MRRRGLRPGAARSAAVRRALGPLLAGIEGVIVGYRALPDEVDLDPLIEVGPERFALTRTPASGLLSAHRLGGAAERHPLGFLQPAADAPVVAATDIGAVLVPGLAFAADGARLGRGGGHYDRFLAGLGDGVARIGVLTGASLVARLPAEAHDQPMTHLVTEAGLGEL